MAAPLPTGWGPKALTAQGHVDVPEREARMGTFPIISDDEGATVR